MIPNNTAIHCKTNQEFEVFKKIVLLHKEVRMENKSFSRNCDWWNESKNSHGSHFVAGKVQNKWRYGSLEFYKSNTPAKIFSIREFSIKFGGYNYVKYIL